MSGENVATLPSSTPFLYFTRHPFPTFSCHCVACFCYCCMFILLLLHVIDTHTYTNHISLLFVMFVMMVFRGGFTICRRLLYVFCCVFC